MFCIFNKICCRFLVNVSCHANGCVYGQERMQTSSIDIEIPPCYAN